MMTVPRTLAAAVTALLLHAAPAHAAGPENVQDLGPKDGEFFLQYVGQFASAGGTDEGRDHSGQSFYGVTDGFAIGGETLLAWRGGRAVRDDRLYFEYDSVIGLFRFADAEKDPVGLGFWVQAGLDSDGELARLEARFIAEKKTPLWWAQGNLMLRRINEEEEEGAHLAYAGRVSRRFGRAWVGVETSGQAVRLGGFERVPFEDSHYAGATAGVEIPLGRGTRAELGASFLHRLDSGRALPNVLQVSAGLRF